MGAPTSSPSVTITQSAANRSYRMPTTAVGTNAVVISTLPCSLFGWQGSNVSRVEYALKLYNLSRVPVVGTDIPLLSVRLPTQEPFPYLGVSRIDFSAGMAMALTQFTVDSDATGIITANDIDGLNIFIG